MEGSCALTPPQALVVEYDPWLRLSLESLLEELGYAVTTASNGFSGLRLAKAERPRVVVVGANLPELSAQDLARELRPYGACSMQLVDAGALLCDAPIEPVDQSPASIPAPFAPRAFNARSHSAAHRARPAVPGTSSPTLGGAVADLRLARHNVPGNRRTARSI